MSKHQWAEWVSVMGIASCIVLVAYGVHGLFGL